MAQQAQNEFYKDDDEMVMDFAAAVNEEVRDLEAAGADVIQLDDPWLRNDPDAAKRIAVPALNRALEGLKVPTVVHLCFGYAAVVPGRSRRATRSCRSSPTARRTRFPSRRRSRSSTSAC